jgi:hypothetical protein
VGRDKPEVPGLPVMDGDEHIILKLPNRDQVSLSEFGPALYLYGVEAAVRTKNHAINTFYVCYGLKNLEPFPKKYTDDE